MGVPVIYFGVETAGLLGQMAETGADVIGLDWRQPLDEGWRAVGHGHAVQGNLDPITLFAPLEVLEQRVKEILRAAERAAGAHLQSWAWDCAGDAGGECAGGGEDGEGVQGRIGAETRGMASRASGVAAGAWNAGDGGADSRVSAQRGERPAGAAERWSRRFSTAIR